jgi:hypothetical protein
VDLLIIFDAIASLIAHNYPLQKKKKKRKRKTPQSSPKKKKKGGKKKINEEEENMTEHIHCMSYTIKVFKVEIIKS